MLVEVCANSLQSARNAQESGAHRIELCSELGVGGLSPSHGLLTLVREQLTIPIHVLIRPRSGHFTYSESEFQVMMADIAFCKELGAEGIVSGVLKADSTLDLKRTRELVEWAKPLHFTFHRAFDWVRHPETVLKQLEGMGVHTVLTSGKQPTAEKGLDNLRKWQKTTQMTLMAGGGVNLENAMRFKEEGFSALHLSGTAFGNRVSLDQKIPMNSNKHLAEHHVAVTNSEVVRQIVQLVK